MASSQGEHSQSSLTCTSHLRAQEQAGPSIWAFPVNEKTFFPVSLWHTPGPKPQSQKGFQTTSTVVTGADPGGTECKGGISSALCRVQSCFTAVVLLF